MQWLNQNFPWDALPSSPGTGSLLMQLTDPLTAKVPTMGLPSRLSGRPGWDAGACDPAGSSHGAPADLTSSSDALELHRALFFRRPSLGPQLPSGPMDWLFQLAARGYQLFYPIFALPMLVGGTQYTLG